MIDMKKQYLGIDLGTSAVKLLLVSPDGNCKRAKCRYRSGDISGWCGALKNAVAMLKEEDPLTDLCAIGLSSQVGTYITDTGEVLSWESLAGGEELRCIKNQLSDAQWLQEIGMVHPDLISYPLPRLLYMKRHFSQCKSVMMPKELLLQELTGNIVTDPFSWRGLCHPDKQDYSHYLLARFGIDLSLPRLGLPTDCAGGVTRSAAEKYGLPENIPVYIGCNDFFAGLLGMGVLEERTVFELSGTSEHLGVLTAGLIDGSFVSGRYFDGFVTYGGTKSSGACCDFAMNLFDIHALDVSAVYANPPLFLPYLKGERAPVYDEKARGVFFGITDKTTAQDMAYAVLEGIVFSLYHIGETLPLSGMTCLITGGGSSGNPLMAKLKAALFDCRVLHTTENDSSALGAAILAMVGDGAFPSAAHAAKAVVCYETAALPDPRLRAQLLRRYEIYKELYIKLKDSFSSFSNLSGGNI